MAYPEKDKKSTSIRIKKGLNEAIEEFIKTDVAKSYGFEYKTDVVNAALRQLLQSFGFLLDQHDYDEPEKPE